MFHKRSIESWIVDERTISYFCKKDEVSRLDNAIMVIATTMTAAWAALGTVCSFHSTLTKSDHSEGGLTYKIAEQNNFTKTESVNSPAI